jgi:hypothetical protein
MRLLLAPKDGWASACAGALAEAHSGDMVLVRGADALDLVKRAYGRMCDKGLVMTGVRLAEYSDFLARIRHDCDIADVEPVSGEWVSVREIAT